MLQSWSLYLYLYLSSVFTIIISLKANKWLTLIKEAYQITNTCPYLAYGKSCVVFLSGKKIIRPSLNCCHCYLLNTHLWVHNLMSLGSFLIIEQRAAGIISEVPSVHWPCMILCLCWYYFLNSSKQQHQQVWNPSWSRSLRLVGYVVVKF